MSKSIYILIAIVLLSTCAESQTSRIGGNCESCEALYDYKDRTLKSTDTLPKFNDLNNKINVSGTIYRSDGKTPAEDIILYIYHTNDKGHYPTTINSKGWEKQHGYIRGWLKTDVKGHYSFYTTRPASYPNSTVPQHIHIVVKEPGKEAYYVEDFYFADDPNITPNIINRKRSRGGSGVIELKGDSSIKTAKRDIILGLNIPNY